MAVSDAGFAALRRELDLWGERGAKARFWWRDDDAIAATAPLERLLQVAAEANAPLTLAVIPAAAEASLAERLLEAPLVTVAMHGTAHRNRAPAGQKKSEFPAGLAAPQVAADLEAAKAKLGRVFAGRPLPLFVPPWNRFADDLLPLLARVGFSGYSTYGARHVALPAPGLTQVNCHLDPIDWRGSRGFLGEEAALAPAISHLRAKRLGEADDGEATGLLSHHLAHDAACWRFVARLLEAVAEHPSAEWSAAGDVFGWRAAA